MAKRGIRRPIGIFLRMADVIATVVAWQLSFFIRFNIMGDGPGSLFGVFLFFSLILAALVIMFSTRNHLYEPYRYFIWHKEFLMVIKSQLESLVTLVMILYFFQPNRLSRLTIGLYMAIGLIFTLTTRGIGRRILKTTRTRGYNLRTVLVIGYGQGLSEYVRILVHKPDQGIQFIGWCSDHKIDHYYGIKAVKMEDVALEGDDAPDAVIIGYDVSNHQELERLLYVFNKTSIRTLIIPDIENAFIGYTIEDFHGLPVISVNSSRLSPYQNFLKRVLDVIISSATLIVFSPLYLLIALLVKISSRGSIFYGQPRISRNGEVFTMWKYRSMKTDADSDGPQWTTREDNRCTPFGSFLRKTSLDEIPQFWNVLKGDMSLVGPRPEQPAFVDQFKHDIPSYMLRHRMKSGITGWAQVNGWRGNSDLNKRIEFDLYYIRNWSLILDIKILFLTFIKGFVNENAY